MAGARKLRTKWSDKSWKKKVKIGKEKKKKTVPRSQELKWGHVTCLRCKNKEEKIINKRVWEFPGWKSKDRNIKHLTNGYKQGKQMRGLSQVEIAPWN